MVVYDDTLPIIVIATVIAIVFIKMLFVNVLIITFIFRVIHRDVIASVLLHNFMLVPDEEINSTVSSKGKVFTNTQFEYYFHDNFMDVVMVTDITIYQHN